MLYSVDYTISDHGSIWLVHPNTDAAREHLETHVDADESTWWSDSLVVEHRYIQPLVEALESHGFTFALDGGTTL